MRSYRIAQQELLPFLGTKIDFPRYQRKKTWKEGKNFELAVSVFQKYPLGILIIDEKNTVEPNNVSVQKRYMLDGRQRYTALKAMVYSPTEVYWWAIKYLGLNIRSKQQTITDKFMARMNILLERDDNTENSKKSKRSKEPDDSKEPNDTTSSVSISAKDNKEDHKNALTAQQLKDLKLLKELILMVRDVPITLTDVEGQDAPKEERLWESLFDFRYDYYEPDKKDGVFDYSALKDHGDQVVNNLEYYTSEETAKRRASNGIVEYRTSKGIVLDKLRKFILDYARYCGSENTEEKFIEYCKGIDTFMILNPDTFKRMVYARWKGISNSVVQLSNAESVFSSTKIGAIVLEEASPLDSLTIFSRVNTNGVKLNPEELLSAKPYWNKCLDEDEDPLINKGDADKERIKKLYTDTLGFPHDGTYRRWDIGATLIDRLEAKFLFGEKKEEGTFMGFRLLATFYSGGMSKVELADLESSDNEGRIWRGDYPKDTNTKSHTSVPKLYTLIHELKQLFHILSKCEFFGRLSRGNMPISELLGIAPAFEFIRVLWESWKNPDGKNQETKSNITIQEEAVRLFDKLVYEVMMSRWGNAGDSRLRDDIKHWGKRVEAPQKLDDWEELIDRASGKKDNDLSYEEMAPILYYFEALKKNGFPHSSNIDNEPYSIDHILPQASFGTGSAYNKDSLANLELLHKSHNSSKGGKRLDQLTDQELIKAVLVAADIDNEELLAYSEDGLDFDEFVEGRVKKLKDLLRNRRHYTGGM